MAIDAKIIGDLPANTAPADTALVELQVGTGTGSSQHTTLAKLPISEAVSAALAGKAAASHTHSAGEITSGTFTNDRLPAILTNKSFENTVDAPFTYNGSEILHAGNISTFSDFINPEGIYRVNFTPTQRDLSNTTLKHRTMHFGSGIQYSMPVSVVNVGDEFIVHALEAACTVLRNGKNFTYKGISIGDDIIVNPGQTLVLRCWFNNNLEIV